jgi:hypothetical protein
MMTPDQRYHSDAQFRCLVDMLSAYVERADFTPSELRIAATLASIKYESRRVRPMFVASPELEDAFATIRKFSKDE